MQQGDNPGFQNEIIEEGFKIEREFKILDLQLSLMTSKNYTKALRGLFRREISSEETWAIAIKHLKRPK